MWRGQEEKTHGEFSLLNPQKEVRMYMCLVEVTEAGFFSIEEGSSDMNWACSFFFLKHRETSISIFIYIVVNISAIKNIPNILSPHAQAMVALLP